MTCDQDDVWLEKKIELTYDKMLAIEKTDGKELKSGLPCLVYTELCVVDSELNTIAANTRVLTATSAQSISLYCRIL